MSKIRILIFSTTMIAIGLVITFGCFIVPNTDPVLRAFGGFHINLKDGEPAYEDRYDVVWNFSEGYARASLNGEYFHITPNGKPAYEERYDYVKSFYEGFARAQLNGKWFHINRDGKPAYEERYDVVLGFSEGYAIACIAEKFFHITPNGKPVVEELYGVRGGCVYVSLNGEFFSFDEDKSLIPLQNDGSSHLELGLTKL